MRKIAVSLTKGGVAKTTTAVNLAAGLAREGYRVLLVDTDTQDQAGFLLGIEPNSGLAQLLNGAAAPENIIMKSRERLWLLAGGEGLAGAKRRAARMESGGEMIFSETMAPFETQFDYVIIDTAPSWGILTVNVLLYAQELLLPVSLDVLTLKGLATFVKRVDMVKKFNPSISLSHVLPTFFDRRVRKSSEILAQLKDRFGSRICSPIRYNVKLSEAAGYGKTIFEYASGSFGAEDYQELTKRIIQYGKTK